MGIEREEAMSRTVEDVVMVLAGRADIMGQFQVRGGLKLFGRLATALVGGVVAAMSMTSF